MIAAGQFYPGIVGGMGAFGQQQKEALWNNIEGLSSDQIRQRLQQAKMFGMSQAEINALSKAMYSASPDSATLPGMESYSPAAAARMMEAYNRYSDIVDEELPQMPDIVSQFVGYTDPATGKWIPGAPDYTQYAWKNANEYYSKYAPGAYKNYEFTTPEIEAIQDITGVPKEIWGEILSGEEERVRQQAKGTREQIAQAVAREGAGRRGATPFLIAQAAATEAQSVDEARRQARIQQAQQELGIRQGTQQLAAQRALAQAGMEQQTQTSQAGEQHYGYEKAADEAKYKTGLDQAYQEAMAGENEKAYQAAYGKAQDVSGLRLTQHQQQMSDRQARAQAALAAAQAAQGIASQVGTYDVQKEKERNAGEAEMANAISGVTNPIGQGIGGALGSASKPAVTKTDMRSRFALNKAKTA